MKNINNYDRIADLYDLYVTADYDIAFWKKEGANAAEVLEVTAGTGRVSLPLVRQGSQVTAVDSSYKQLQRLAEKAASEGLHVHTVKADMRDFDLGKTFPLVIIPFQSLQELIEPCDVTAALRRVRAHLAPEGRAIITLHNPGTQTNLDCRTMRLVDDYTLPNSNRMLFWMARSYDAATHIGTSYQLYEEYDVDGVLHRKRLFTPRYHVFEREDIEQRIAQAGLRITAAWGGYDWSPLDENSRFMIFELRL
ncbi:MAG TPA: class I SAM-dependent methyltransferase [Bacteroidota bacterium]|mgnify:FL=1|nr:class I SAM-dependent methyltransferase [Bacteroidota bacterium]